MTCKKCHRGMWPLKRKDKPEGMPRHYGRGLCGTCYRDATRNGTLDQWETTLKPAKPKAYREPTPPATECKECHRALRSTSTKVADAPGTVVHRSNGLCTSCWRRANGLVKGDRTPRPDNCVQCQVKLRANHVRPEDHPDAVRHGGKGLCARCYNASGRAEPVKRTPDSCTTCEHPLRPSHTRIEDYPGTKLHYGHGLCSSCWSREHRNPASTVVEEPAEVAPAIEDPALNRLLAQRQERIRRQQQVQRIRVAQEAARRRFTQSRQAA